MQTRLKITGTAFGTLLLFAGCSDDATSTMDETDTGTGSVTEADSLTGGPVCTPGSAMDCTCSDGARGERQCLSDGSGFGTCECAPIDTTTGTSTGTTDTTDTTDTTATETGDTDTDTEDTGVECTDDCSMIEVSACQEAICNQEIGECQIVALVDGTDCSSFCIPEGMCAEGQCNGTHNDCGLTPEQCETVVCDEQSRTCAYENLTDGTTCALEDLCALDPVCDAGVCVETDYVDCSDEGNACLIAECNPENGQCELEPEDGAMCANTYFVENFSACASLGWTLTNDWECGAPTVGPNGCRDGSSCLGTVLDADYNHNQSYDSTFAEFPAIDLADTNAPTLGYWHWVDTEGSTFDGYHVAVSTDGGTSWSVLETVVPPYPLTVGGAPAYGGRMQAWQYVTADLSAYVGESVSLRFSFRSDGSVAHPGVFIDDVRIAEANAIPLSFVTTSLFTGFAGEAYEVALQRAGGGDDAAWSIVGGVNADWLSIDPATGVLSGTPAVGELGAVQVTVRVEQPGIPENFAEWTYDFEVLAAAYSESFQVCPGDWVLGGDWQCGVPTSGPGAAFDDTQCIATQLAGDYSHSQAWAVATATSPSIDLPAGPSTLSFRIWLRTEGSTFDGTNVKISTDGGSTFDVVTSVTPDYPLTIDGQPAWGGNQAAAGWQEFFADLSAYSGQTVQLQFGFRSDGSVAYPGVYIDRVRVYE